MKRRIKKLELLDQEKNFKLIVVEKINEDLYIQNNSSWGNLEKIEYTKADLEEKEKEGYKFLIMVWAED